MAFYLFTGTLSELIDAETVESIFGTVKEILSLGESALKLSLASIMNLVTLGFMLSWCR